MADVQPVLSGERLRELQQLVRRLPIPPSAVKYAVQAGARDAAAGFHRLGRGP